MLVELEPFRWRDTAELSSTRLAKRGVGELMGALRKMRQFSPFCGNFGVRTIDNRTVSLVYGGTSDFA